MPRISQFYGILIYMYYRGHPTPHFHALYGEHEAVVDIATGTVTVGGLPRKATELVAEWAASHRAELFQNWERARTGQPLNPVPRWTRIELPMILRIVKSEVRGPYKLQLTFNNGTHKTVDLRPLLQGPIFEPLRDAAYFSLGRVDPVCGTIMWPNGADFAPEALYELAAQEPSAA
jgi:hypothetical protein